MGYNPGAVDGVYGSRTRAALRLGQDHHNRGGDGPLTETTMGQLLR